MKTSLKDTERGFSLVELMIVLVTATIVLGGMYMAMRASSTQIQTADVSMVLHDDAREGLHRMIEEIRKTQADQIVTLTSSTITFNVPSTNMASLADPSNNYEVDWTQGSQISYAIGGTNSDQIIRTETPIAGGAATTNVLTNDVTGVTFTADNAPPDTDVITVTLSVQKTLIDGTLVPSNAPLSLTAQAEIRNR